MIYAIVGMGRSGEAAQRFLLRSGISASDIVTFDEKAGVAEFSDPAAMMASKNPGVLVVSPGVPLSRPWIHGARKNGVQITSELSLACEDLRGERLIGVTGSVGKSTTVALLGEGALAIDPHVFVGGNFGTPLCDYVADVREGLRPRAKWLILELSSFQLENCAGLTLDFGAITFLGPNHLERYNNLEDYYRTKFLLIEHARGTVFLNKRGGDLGRLPSLPSRKLTWADRNDPALAKYHLEQSKLLGEHQQDNLAVAAGLALEAGWGEASIARMKHFAGLPHRLQNLGTFNGVRFVNDSKATALESVAIAIHSCLAGSQNVFVLLGGRDKNLPWATLAALKGNPRLHPLFFGECGKLAHDASGLEGPVFAKLGQAIAEGIKQSRQGDTVLLSPGGSSLDEFKNFEKRGEYFAAEISK